MTPVPVISLWQPWSKWVSLGIKTTETRLHDRFRSLFHKRIAIHATAKFDALAIPTAKAFTNLNLELLSERHEPGIVATAYVADVRWLFELSDSGKALIDCNTVKRFGLVLTEIKRIPLIPCKGSRGIWYMEHPSL